MKKVSIFIRTYNNENTIELVLKGIFKQVEVDFEVLVVDSGSSDRTLEILSKFPISVHHFREEYNPAKVLNLAIRMCKNEIIVFNNSDCIPSNELWLKKLIQNISLKSLCASYCVQLAHENAYESVKRDHDYAFGRIQRNKDCNFFSMASSATNKFTLFNIPFSERMFFSEDVEWSQRIKACDGEIFFESESKVFHSHNYSFEECRNRFYNEGVAEYMIFGKRKSFLKNFLLSLMKNLIADIYRIIQRGRITNLLKELQYRVAQKYYFYRGTQGRTGFLKRLN